MTEMVGVLGGLGPVASAEFVRTIYARCADGREQDYPAVLLRSDPRFAHRTAEAMDNGDLARQLGDGIAALQAQGSGRIVIACMTLHHLLPGLSPSQREAVVSVLDVVFAQVSRTPGRHLLMCSRDARQVRLFERDSRWPLIESRIVLPSIARNDALQDAIGDIKTNRGHGAARRWIERAVDEHDVDSMVVGCSEIHVLARHWPADALALTWIDPFELMASAIAEHRNLTDLTSLKEVRS